MAAVTQAAQALVLCPLVPFAAGQVRVTGLRCEYQVNPVGVNAAAPRLSWVLEALDPRARGTAQSAYEVLVATSMAEGTSRKRAR
jgi:alpha-L-rhamnosidase